MPRLAFLSRNVSSSRVPLLLALGALVLAALNLAACARPSPPTAAKPSPAAPPEVVLTPQESGTEALLISIDAVSAAVAWIGGTGGTVLRTLDGGRSWQRRPVPGADSLQFRDVEAVDARTAYVLSIGSGSASRIYKTTDGGARWTLQFQNDDPQAFFDCMAFWDARHGFAFSDAVETPGAADARLPILVTDDGGRTWTRVEPERTPAAFGGEGSFAASGTCAAARGERHGWIGTGNAPGRSARVFRTTDRGRSWQAAPAPIDAGEGAGIASVVFPDVQRGYAFGGDIGAPARSDSTAARTTDGGRSWQRAAGPAIRGPIYGAAAVPGSPGPVLVAVGPGGASYTTNGARSWTALDTTTYWGAAFAGPDAGWLVGPEGRITKAQLRF